MPRTKLRTRGSAPRPAWVALGIFLGSSLLAAPPAQAEGPSAIFVPHAGLGLRDLIEVVGQHSVAAELADLDVEVAKAEVQQSQVLPNPTLDGSWGTIPVGDTNPLGLDRPFSQIPNYGVGLSYTFLLGKRGPRQERALAARRGAEAARRQTLREQALDLARVLGQQASVLLRLDGMKGLTREGEEALVLAEARVKAQFGVPLEADRLRIDVERTKQQVHGIEGALQGSLAQCAALIGAPCQAFPSSTEARAFLAAWIAQVSQPTAALTERPDVQRLEAEASAAAAERAYANALSIPDPTVRVGYLHDTFVVAGNQLNSLNLSVSVPLPVFDRGQADVERARARQERLNEARSRTLTSARAVIPALRERIDAHLQQQDRLQNEILPRAHQVLDALEKAAENRLVPMTDVLQARRTLSELLIDEATSYHEAFDAAVSLAAELPSARETGK